MKIAFDPGALLRIHEHGLHEEQLAECVLERLDDGQLVMQLFGDDGEVVISISLRSDFLVRIEHAAAASAEAAA